MVSPRGKAKGVGSLHYLLPLGAVTPKRILNKSLGLLEVLMNAALGHWEWGGQMSLLRMLNEHCLF